VHHAPRVEQAYLFLFAEGARVRIVDPLPSQQAYFRLASVGAGLRFKGFGLLMDLDAARALEAGYVTKSGSTSGQFRVNFAW
jgi:hypothetical protein